MNHWRVELGGEWHLACSLGVGLRSGITARENVSGRLTTCDACLACAQSLYNSAHIPWRYTRDLPSSAPPYASPASPTHVKTCCSTAIGHAEDCATWETL